MPDIVAIGPLMIRGDMLAVILACAVGLAVMHINLKRAGSGLLPLSDVVLTAAVIVFICWKAGPLLSEPEILWQSPLKLVMLPGAIDGVLFGVILAAAYVLNRLRKLAIPLMAALDGIAFFGMGSGLVYTALTIRYGYETSLPWGIREIPAGAGHHPVFAYLAIVLAGGLIWAWKRHSAFGSGQTLRFTLLLIGIGGLAVSLLAPQTPSLLWLSGVQLACLAASVSGVLVGNRIGTLPQTHTNSGKELSDMPKERSGDSMAQRNQERENKGNQAERNVVDKKLDGPNRPST